MWCSCLLNQDLQKNTFRQQDHSSSNSLKYNLFITEKVWTFSLNRDHLNTSCYILISNYSNSFWRGHITTIRLQKIKKKCLRFGVKHVKSSQYKQLQFFLFFFLPERRIYVFPNYLLKAIKKALEKESSLVLAAYLINAWSSLFFLWGSIQPPKRRKPASPFAGRSGHGLCPSSHSRLPSASCHLSVT